MLDTFRSDTCAIEGLPARLVVILVVGVASMSAMLNILSGVQGPATSELDMKPTPNVVGSDEQALDSIVVDHERNPVEGVTVIVKSETAEVDGVATAKSDDGGPVTVNVNAELGANREGGTLVVDVKPPAGESSVDRRENTNVPVVQD